MKCKFKTPPPKWLEADNQIGSFVDRLSTIVSPNEDAFFQALIETASRFENDTLPQEYTLFKSDVTENEWAYNLYNFGFITEAEYDKWHEKMRLPRRVENMSEIEMDCVIKATR